MDRPPIFRLVRRAPMNAQAETDLVREAIERLPWRTALPADSMPAHQYVILGKCPGDAWDVLDGEIRDNPESYDAYFRGYLWPMHYWEFEGYRFWRTSAKGPTHMLNRCTLDSVEPPRRVDEGTRGNAGVAERLGELLESPAIEHLPRVLVPVEVDDCSRVQVHATALAVQLEVAEPIEATRALPGTASDRQEHQGLSGLKPSGPSELRPHCVSTRAEVPHEGGDDLIRRHRIRSGPTEAASRRMSSIELHCPGPMTLDGGTTS